MKKKLSNKTKEEMKSWLYMLIVLVIIFIITTSFSVIAFNNHSPFEGTMFAIGSILSLLIIWIPVFNILCCYYIGVEDREKILEMNKYL